MTERTRLSITRWFSLSAEQYFVSFWLPFRLRRKGEQEERRFNAAAGAKGLGLKPPRISGQYHDLRGRSSLPSFSPLAERHLICFSPRNFVIDKNTG